MHGHHAHTFTARVRQAVTWWPGAHDLPGAGAGALARCWPGDLVARPMHHGHTFTARARQAVTWCHGLPGAGAGVGCTGTPPPLVARQALGRLPSAGLVARDLFLGWPQWQPMHHSHTFTTRVCLGVSGFWWLGAVGAAGSRRWPEWQPTRNGYTFTTWARLVRWPGGRDSKRA